MPALGEVHVRGLRELNRAFARAADQGLKKDLRKALRDVAEPVRRDAEDLAASRIRNIVPQGRRRTRGTPGRRHNWSKMRIGVSQSVVYVAPREKGRRTTPQTSRPNLADLLMNRAMQPALEGHTANVERALERVFDGIQRRWEA